MIVAPDLVFLCICASLGVASAASSPCDSPKVLSLPLQDIQVLPNVKDSFMRGIALKAGSPAQNLTVLPWAELNNTWLYDYQPFCDSSIIFSDTICRVRRGNFFFENTSSTYHKQPDIAAAGGAGQETNVSGSESGIPTLISTSLIGADTLGLGGSSLASFPIGIPRKNWDHGYTILHAMGMGSNSTVLNRLVETGQIASRVWSIFWGRMWNENPIDGSVVLGGYDTEKLIGQNYTQPLDYSNTTGCWTGMKVTITGLGLVDRTGDTTSILPPNTVVDVCIVPQRQLLLEAPGGILNLFENVTGTRTIGPSFGLHWSAALYESNSAYTGDMIISFSSGLQITVPNDQFMVPFVTIDRNGSRIFNESQREFLFNAILDQPPTLGRYFLTSAYLMVNHDANTFTLWQANPSTTSQLVPVVAENANTDACITAVTTAQPSATDSSPAPRESNSSSPQRLSGGIIAAVVVASLAAVGIFTLGGVYIIRARRRRQESRLLEETAAAQISVLENNKGFRQTRVHEMHSESRPYEMQGSEGIVYELDGRTAS